jgi:hypothetical protein
LNLLELFTIYENPSDYPGRFVVRRFVATRPPTTDVEPLAVVKTLAEARAAIPPGMDWIGRYDADDPCIVETWC